MSTDLLSPAPPAPAEGPRHRPRREPRRVVPRRSGDPARIVASGDLAAADLDWRMRHSLQEMVASAWQARTTERPSSRPHRATP